MNIDQEQVQIFQTQNQLVAGKKGPLACRLILDFSQQPEYDLDMQNIQTRGQFDLCQTVYIDNADGAAPVILIIPSSGLRIVAKPGTQGFYNVICPNPIGMRFLGAGGSVVTIFLIDVAIPGATWSAI